MVDLRFVRPVRAGVPFNVVVTPTATGHTVEVRTAEGVAVAATVGDTEEEPTPA